MNYYDNIKDYLIRNEINHRVKDYSKNKSDLETYYNVGKLIVEAQGGEKRAKYGDGLIKEYSQKLTNELGKKYSSRYLELMRKFYLFQKTKPLVSELSWSHYIILLSLKDDDEINYYIDTCIKYNLSKRKLLEKIKNKEYQRLDFNTKEKLKNNKKLSLIETIKEPIIISNPNNIEVYKEKVLHDLILDDWQHFLKELGDGYALVDSEYQIKVGDRYYYIDLLLYNIEYNSYVVVELKIGELKVEHIGQVLFYINSIDETIKKETDNKTIGIILVHKNNKLILKYSSDSRITAKEYIVSN